MERIGRQQVIDALHRRRDHGPGGDERLVLCIEGGGLRGVVSAAMVLALHDLGFTAEHFDAVYGASAGALAGAYFIDGDVGPALPLYYRDVPAFFLDWTRPLRGRPVLALDRVVDHTITVARPLDIGRVLASGKLRVVATDIGETAGLGRRHPQPIRAECFAAPSTAGELREYLRASTRIPVLGGPPVSIEDPPDRCPRRHAAHAYLDAFLTEGLPVDAPVTDGATHLVVLTTKPYHWPRVEGRLAGGFTRWMLRRLNPDLPHHLDGMPARVERRAAFLDRAQGAPDPGEPAVWCVSPPVDPGVPRLKPDVGRIIAAAEVGYRLIRKELGLDQPVAFETDPEFRPVWS